MIAAAPAWLPEPVRALLEHAVSARVLAALSLLSVLTFVGSLLALPWLIARLPTDYFVEDGTPPSAVLRSERAISVARVVRPVLGTMLILAGVAMLVLPGQGVLTILVGLSLLDFPGKRRLQRRIVSRPRVLGALNAIRARAHKPPLVL
ncbi:MAG: PGPGW domain-containing protein [Polyangiaceae bacterium]